MQRLYKKYQLLIWLGSLLVIGFVGEGFLTRYASEKILIEQNAQQTLPLSGDAVHAEIQRNIIRSVMASARLADDAFLREWVSVGDDDKDKLLLHLKSAQRKDQSIVHFFASERDHLFYDSQGAIRALNSENPRDAWYFKSRHSVNFFETLIVPDEGINNQAFIYISYPIKDAEGNLMGTSGVILPLELLSALVDHYVSAFKLGIYFTDANGRILLSDNKHNKHGNLHELDGIKQYADDLLSNDHSSLSKTIEVERSGLLMNSRFIPELGWYLVIEQTTQEASAATLPLTIIQVAFGAMITALALLLTWLSLHRHHQNLTTLATSDGMTGLMNRQSFTTSFQKAVLEMRRFKSPLSFILFDIDFLKKINESHGHITGDRIIMEIAQMSKRSVRGSDLLCRWGGEQFALLLKKCELEQAYKIAEQLRLNVQNYSFSLGSDTPVTISLGVAQWGENETSDEFFARVDDAMFLAKAEGRNRAEVSYYAKTE